jgi:hypothetical protein
MTVAIVHRLLDRLGIPRDRLPAEELYRWEPMRLARMVARLNKRVGRRGWQRANAPKGQRAKEDGALFAVSLSR